MTDLISDIKEFFNDRIRSPFIVSFMFAWVVWNWFLVYSVCSFPDSIPLAEKTKFINDYIQNHKASNLTWIPLKYSFGVTLVYIMCSSVFLFVFSYYKASIRPWILKKTSLSDMIERVYYDKLEYKFNRLKDDYEKNKVSNHDIEAQMKATHKKYMDLLTQEESFKDKYEEMQEQIKEIEKEKAELKKLEHFVEKKLEFFEGKFLNQKTWFLYTRLDEAKIQTEELRFEIHAQVRDAETDQIKYVIENIRFSQDSMLMYFTLSFHHDRNVKYTFYLIERDYNFFRGTRIMGSTKVDVVLTQPKPSKETVITLFSASSKN